MDSYKIIHKFENPIRGNIIKLDNEYGISLEPEEVLTENFGNVGMVIKEIVKDLLELFPTSVLYGQSALNIYTDNFKNGIIFYNKIPHKLNFMCGEKIWGALKSSLKDYFMYKKFCSNTDIKDVIIEEDINKINIELQLLHIYFTLNIHTKIQNLYITFEKFTSGDLKTHIFNKCIDCYCIIWDGLNFYTNDRFEKSQILKIVYYTDDNNLIDLHDCLYIGYAIIIPGLNIERFISGLSCKYTLKGLDKITYDILEI